jgi:hypothetical protein
LRVREFVSADTATAHIGAQAAPDKDLSGN